MSRITERKYWLTIIAFIVLSLTTIVLALISKDFELTSGVVFAFCTGMIGIVSAIVYGYTKEYEFKNTGEKK